MTAHQSAISAELAAAAAALSVSLDGRSTPEEALKAILCSHDYAVTKMLKGDDKLLATVRHELRHELLGQALVDPAKPTEFQIEFNGGGDEGCYSLGHLINTSVGAFLTLMGEKHVTFNWYDNEGGGGDITWDVKTDKVIINGYSYYTETQSEMEEEVF